MTITLDHISKKFHQQWVIRELSYSFQSGESYAVLGANGSGKSTLVQIISGFLSPTSGSIHYQLKGNQVPREQLHALVSVAAPWADPLDDLTLAELISFHVKFRPFVDGVSTSEAIAVSGLEKSRDKLIRSFSSGMKQRVRLTLALLSKSDIILLDEPVSNLDAKGVSWYQKLISDHASNRTVIIASNHVEQEYIFCSNRLEISGAGDVNHS